MYSSHAWLHILAVAEQDQSSALNLQSSHHLDTLFFELVPSQEPYGSTLESLQETLLSWVTSDERALGCRPLSRRHRTFYLEPYRSYFRRKELVNLLRPIGSVVEAALCSKHTAGDSLETDTGGNIENDPCQVTVVVDDLGDRSEWADWWETRIRECFPTFAKWNRLEVYPSHSGE